MEHRWGQRIAVDRAVRLTGRPSALGFGRLCNLSLSGAWIGTKLRLATGVRLYVSVEPVEPGSDAPSGVEACVVRRDATGLGVEWCDQASELVLQWLRHATGAPALGAARGFNPAARARASP
jgi:hypothetical protein